MGWCLAMTASPFVTSHLGLMISVALSTTRKKHVRFGLIIGPSPVLRGLSETGC